VCGMIRTEDETAVDLVLVLLRDYEAPDYSTILRIAYRVKDAFAQYSSPSTVATIVDRRIKEAPAGWSLFRSDILYPPTIAIGSVVTDRSTNRRGAVVAFVDDWGVVIRDADGEIHTARNRNLIREKL